MENKHLHKALVFWTTLCRLVLGMVFIFSGFVKAVDPLGSQYKIEDYLEAFNLAAYVPAFIPLLAAILQGVVEFVLGVWLTLGIRRKISTYFILVIMCLMTPLTFYLALENPISDCGCFGDAWVITNWQTFWKNIGLLIAAVSVFKWRRLLFPVISEKSQWIVAIYTIFFIFAITGYCLNRLPVLDFRPYRIGNSIPEGMSIPEGAVPNRYESRFILEKDGVKQEFTLENYPDSTWTFVEARSVLVQKGYEPSIHDFSIVTQEEGEDITEEVLSDPGYTFLLIAHRLEKADDANIDLINEIFDYSVENGYAFYCLTSSSDEEIENWRERTGAEYPFTFTDDITLKTIIRANPGLLLLKEGVILNKWNYTEVPDEYALSDRLENLELGRIKEINNVNTIGRIILWFFLPLFVVLGIDRLWLKRKK
ncbi:MAG: DoxX family protein [Bacteroides sp.]|nr:DoxX family protein [Bacteroides sp.]